ncbi:MAG: nicotinate-nucleotide adenylyltransferase [Pirellulales bacterium]|jgi:nicotinate-nucleotide adenylyltransferase
MAKELAIFGGSFNPVHLGHLIVAECCLEQAHLDRVIFMPAATPPHKQNSPIACSEDRIAMVRLAIAGHDKLDISLNECDRGGISYTVDTVSDLVARHPHDCFSLILGPDALRDLPSWRTPRKILDLVTILAIERRGIDDIDKTLQEPRLKALLSNEQSQLIKKRRIRVPGIGIRAEQIREEIAAGHSIRFRTPRDVEQFILHNQLYRTGKKNSTATSSQEVSKR